MKILRWIKKIYTRWDYEKYWRCRDEIYNKNTGKIKQLYCRYYVTKQNRRYNADIRFIVGGENNFSGWPILGHRLNGIVIAGRAKIGKNCFLSHQVTIGRSRGGAPTIGDNVYIGPGAKIFGGITIGDNVRIGANCVVFEDIPDNATVVLPKPRIIQKDPGYQYYTASPGEWRKEYNEDN